MVHRQKAYQDRLANLFFFTVCQYSLSYYHHHHVVYSHIASCAFTFKLLSYCVRSIMLLRMISLASLETSYCSKIMSGSLISSFLNSGSLAALRRTSLIISASFCC